jgi:hypothetical protein
MASTKSSGKSPARSVCTMVETIRGAIPVCATAKEYLDKVASQFTGLSKTYAGSLVSEFINTRHDGSVVRAYI